MSKPTSISSEDNLKALSRQEYLDKFIGERNSEDIKETYQRAWEAKNFEIDNYWKRATYFWAFQVATFTGYLTTLSSELYSKHPQVLYFIICIGVICSLAWHFTNKGSKTWQRNWEKHVDALEDEVTGPLYKTVTTKKTYSVSKINEIVSRFFSLIWILFLVKYFIDNLTFIKTDSVEIDYLIIAASVLTLYTIYDMHYGYGRGRFKKREVKFYNRNIKYD